MASPRETAAERPSSLYAAPLAAVARTRAGASSWTRGGLFLLLAGLLYGPYVRYLVGIWLHVPEYAHGFLLPAFAALMLWDRRDEIMEGAWQPSWWALPFVGAGALGLLAGTLMGEMFSVGISMVLVILGGLLAVGGLPLFRAAWFPASFLGFGIPLPDGILIATLGDPLRLQAARWSAALLDWLGYPVLLQGTLLNLPRISLEVAYECSGVRGLIAAIPLALAVGYLFHRSWKARTALCLAAVPIGLVSNLLRILAIAVRAYRFVGTPTEAQLHGSTGWIPTLVILPMLFALSGVIRWIERPRHSGSR